MSFRWLPITRISIIPALCLALTFPSGAVGQFISRDYYPLWGEPYENYGAIGYRDALHPILGEEMHLTEGIGLSDVISGFDVELERRQYDPFGNYLVDGLDVFRLEEFRSIAPNKGSILFKSDLYESFFRNLVIASDAFSGWSNRIIIGDAIRTKFTSLTLSQARLNGIRWDGATRRNRFTVLGSRISTPTWIPNEESAKEFATYLFGGRWENTVGDLLTMGVSYVTAFRSDTFLRHGHIQRGVVPIDLGGVKDLYVIFSDDSPEDRWGAEVYALEVYINGVRAELQPEAVWIPDITLDIPLSSNVQDDMPLSRQYLSYLRADGPWLSQAVNYNNTRLAPLIRLEQVLKRRGQPVVLSGGQPLEASGSDVLVFKYRMPSEARSVQFRALMANDYTIDVATRLENWDDWHNVARAVGHVRDRCNLGWVSFEYGFPTGLVTYGLDFELRLGGVHMRGEYSNNIGYFAYPGTRGGWQSEKTQAYVLNVLSGFRRADVGVELFYIPATYRTSFPSREPTLANAPVSYYDLVEDNDDRDEWADSEDHDGIFPGLDEDGDGVIDTNVNGNGVPDYQEPFLMYYVDPDGFVFGDDFNNNGVVDVREDDNRPDYPYDLDRRGQHIFTRFKIAPFLHHTVGWYRVHRIVGGGRNRVLYGKLEYKARREGLGTLGVHYLLKRVHDTIPSDLRGGYLTSTGFVSEGTIQPDLLSMRNSLVNLVFLESTYTGIPHLNVANKLRYEVNARRAEPFDDGTVQRKARDRTWALMSRADYTWTLGDLTIVPMVKFLTERKIIPSSGRRPFLHTQHLIPILRVDYRFSPSTVLRIGAQGFPFLKEWFRNVAWPFDQYDATSQVVLLQNRGNYSGYDVALNLGFRRMHRDVRSEHTRRSTSSNELFLQVYVE